MQAITQVNAIEASKFSMQKPTRHESREGRRRWKHTSEPFHQTCRGIGDGMQAKGTIRNTGQPQR